MRGQCFLKRFFLQFLIRPVMLNNGILIHRLRLLANILMPLSTTTCDAASNTLHVEVSLPGEAVS